MNALITPGQVPFLPRGVRLGEDRVRGIRVLHAPERTMQLDAIGAAILDEIDGTRSLADISARLAERYLAPLDQISTDVAAFLTALIERRMVFVREAP